MSPPSAQLRFAFDAPDHGGLPLRAPQFVRHPRARRYVLRLLADGTPRVTIPRRGSQREAESFLAAQQAWLAHERARLESRLAARIRPAWHDGSSVLVRGLPRVLVHKPESERNAVRLDGDVLIVQTRAAAPDLRKLVLGWLWQLGRVELPPRLQALAAEHGLQVAAVSVRNQRTRWGSCASNRRISLNWRLVQTPDAVRDYVILHELMHLRMANHSARFWKLVAGVCPGYELARQWLRQHERSLLDA